MIFTVIHLNAYAIKMFLISLFEYFFIYNIWYEIYYNLYANFL